MLLQGLQYVLLTTGPLSILNLGRERPLTQIIMAKLIKASFLIRVHGLPPLRQVREVSIGYEEDEVFTVLG